MQEPEWPVVPPHSIPRRPFCLQNARSQHRLGLDPELVSNTGPDHRFPAPNMPCGPFWPLTRFSYARSYHRGSSACDDGKTP